MFLMFNNGTVTSFHSVDASLLRESDIFFMYNLDIAKNFVYLFQ